MQLDTAIVGGLVVDGSPNSIPRPRDIGVRRGRLVELEPTDEWTATTIVEAKDLVVCPGFIDTHTHLEMASLTSTPDRWAAVGQGITTTLVGADGFGWVGIERAQRRRWWDDHASLYGPPPDPLPVWDAPGPFLSDVRAHSCHDVVALVPHGNVRAAVVGDRLGPATRREMAAMITLVEQWIDEGAVGLATGLDYLPGRSAATDEIVALARVVAANEGVYASHVRTLDLGRADGWREAAEIGYRAGMPVCIAHERLDETGRTLIAELDNLVELNLDSYVYPAGCTGLTFHVPADDLAGGVQALAVRLADDVGFAARLAAQLDERLTATDGYDALVAATSSGTHEGRSLHALAAERDISVGEAAVDLLRDELPLALIVYVWQALDDTWAETERHTLTDPHTMIATDGVYVGSRTHPRGFGTFPRLIGEHVRDRATLDLGTAIHKMTGKPAAVYGLTDRGLIEAGRRADLTIFDLAAIGCPADHQAPRHSPVGIEAVMVDGEFVVDRLSTTGRHASERRSAPTTIREDHP